MTILEWIDYSFIVLFFLGMGTLLFIIAWPSQEELAREKLPPVRQEKVAYAALVALFLFFLMISWITNKHPHS